MQEEPRWRRYLRFWSPDPGADVDDELEFHIAERARLNVARGLAPEAADAEARARFGDIVRIRGECIMQHEKSMRRLGVMDSLSDVARDVRIGLRSLARTPMFTLAAGLALALGIGANTAVFSAVSAVLLRPLPYAEPERVVAVFTRWEGVESGGLSPAEYLDYAERVRAFESLGVYALTSVNVVEGDGADRLPAAAATPSVFDALGIAPALGRFFDGTATAEVPRVVLSHEYWQTRFGGAVDVVGRSVLVNGTARTVVGVMPAGVRLPSTYGDEQPPSLLLPLSIDRAGDPARGSHFLRSVGRLAPGWTADAANAELSRVAQQLVAEHPDDYPAAMRFDTFVLPVHDVVVGDTRRLLGMLMAAVALVLLIACANVSGLVLTRTEDRRRELAVRTALGASRWRITRQLLVEHLVLALLAGAAGILIALAGVHALALLQPGDIPRLGDAAIDGRALAFTFVLSLAVTLLVALVPLRFGSALRTADARGGTSEVLREAGTRTTTSRASQRMRRALIAAEVALSIVLVAAGGLLLRSLANMLAVDPGYRTAAVLTVPVSLPFSSYAEDAAIRRFYAQLEADAAQIPGVVAAGAVINLPLAANVGDLNIHIEGREVAPGDASPRLDWQVVTPGWFDAMGVQIVRGRALAHSDDDRAPGAVVLSEAAARRHWGDADAIGRRFRLGGGAAPGWVTVVGIARDIRHAALTDEPPPIMYLAHAQFTFWNGGVAPTAMTMVLHTAGEPMAALPALRDIVRRLDPHVPLGTARTMEQVVGTAVAVPRFAGGVIAAFALLALALAMLGIYGLVGYTVARRTREIAVRMALGAAPRGVVRQIVLQGMQPVFAGIVVGAIGALLVTRTLQHMLFGVKPHDPITIGGTLLLLAATGVVACVLPARRAAGVAPLQALREE